MTTIAFTSYYEALPTSVGKCNANVRLSISRYSDFPKCCTQYVNNVSPSVSCLDKRIQRRCISGDKICEVILKTCRVDLLDGVKQTFKDKTRKQLTLQYKEK